jgi:hypothetical protein
MSENTGSVGADTEGQGVETSEPVAAETSAKSPLKPIKDDVWKRGKSLDERAVEGIIKTSKEAAKEAAKPKVAKYESEDLDTPADKRITRPDEKGEEVGVQRDEKGRFVAADTDKATPAPKESAQAEKPATPAAASPKVKFAGQEWDDLSAAEKAYAERDWHLARAIESANAWKAEAERRVQAQASPAAAPEPSKSETPAQADATGLDPEMVQEVYAAAQEAGKPWLFTQWVAEENAKQVQALIDRRLGEITKPQQEAQAREHLQREILDGWTSLKQYTRADGSPAFPEVGNYEAEKQIGEFWVALGLPVEAMRNPASLMAAIGLYRLMTEGATPTAAAVPAPPPPAPNADAEAVTTGLPSRIPPGSESESPEVRYLHNALSRVGHRGQDANGRVVNLWSR